MSTKKQPICAERKLQIVKEFEIKGIPIRQLEREDLSTIEFLKEIKINYCIR